MVLIPIAVASFSEHDPSNSPLLLTFPPYNMLHCHKWVLPIIEGSFRAGKRSNHIGYRFRSLWSMSTIVSQHSFIRAVQYSISRFMFYIVSATGFWDVWYCYAFIQSLPLLLSPYSKCVCECVYACVQGWEVYFKNIYQYNYWLPVKNCSWPNPSITKLK